MDIYLDNAATTRVCPEAADMAYRVMTEQYGNPSSTHARGREAKNEFGESYAPDRADNCTLSSSIVMQLRRSGEADRPFRVPEWAYVFTDETIPPRSLHPEGNKGPWHNASTARTVLWSKQNPVKLWYC